MTPPVLHIINLPRSTDRRASIADQVAKLDLPFVFFDAIDGHVPHPLCANIDRTQRLAQKGRPFRPGEMGCWASHYLLWQHCVEGGVPIIVLEDDIVLDPRLPEVLQALPALPEDVGYFRLHAADCPSTPWRRFGDFVLHRYWRSPMCAFGYYLAPSAAQRLLQHAKNWVLPVDDYMDLAWLHGVECLGLKPAVVSCEEVFDSTIRAGGKQKATVGAAGRMGREIRRAWLDLRWQLHNAPARLWGRGRNPV